MPAPNSNEATEALPAWDVFISHASEDKDALVRPLAQELRTRGLRVWYDEFELRVGDSLRASIDQGLARSAYGIVILSPQFFAKHWPPEELNGLAAREAADGRKVILPVWHGVRHAEVTAESPTLADRRAASSDQPIEALADELLEAMEQGLLSSGQASAPTAVDQDQLDALLHLVNRESMRRLRDQDFAAPWPSDLTTPLLILLMEHNETEHRFVDEQLEDRRRQLVDAAHRFMNDEAMNGFVNNYVRGMRDTGYTPAEAEGHPERVELLDRRSKLLRSRAQAVLTAYEEMLGLARERGYRLDVLSRGPHPRVAQHDNLMRQADRDPIERNA